VAASASIQSLSTEPAHVGAPDAARKAIAAADLVVIGPGSLYTSVLAACVVPGISDSLAQCTARRVFVANLHEQSPETHGYSIADHVDALHRHGVVIDHVVIDPRSSLVRGVIDLPVTEADITGANGKVHDASKLARCLSDLVA